ncbi:FUSC family protein [Thalassolituus sp. ST750PaO-4]|uniref:FUSC family protein n=1 Tax=Thalassolituus sp. ST750PaO-4 TaxID=2742965 RepID=UPI000C39F83E|nr:FUSC family protein [Thalassolituus sp. ST750PaO-4]MCA6059523.1 FUSC family protein [Thalassolituus sp. ST750PaO-4]PIQ39867.1 MAG: FUSC family protein [Thalassolituus sp. CG17_big_fil_post_rev_8_21_14_2_50_53_8]
MPPSPQRSSRWSIIKQEMRALLHLNPTTRPWHLPLLVACCSALPALAGVLYGDIKSGILGCVGALVILYLPAAGLRRRLLTLLACSLGFQLSFLLASISSGPLSAALMLLLITMASTFLTRWLSMPPPGSFFFILVAALASVLPHETEQISHRLLLVGLGSAGACILALLYSLLLPAETTPPVSTVAPARRILAEATVIAVFVAASSLLANALQLHNPYWVPISCAAIIQGANFRLVWQRKIHRVVGTALGLGIAWLIFALQPNGWMLVLIIGLLSFSIEVLVVRNYGIAMLFITPLTLLFAEITALQSPLDTLMLARFSDILLGSLIGLIGGWLIHHPRYLGRISAQHNQD